MKFKKIAFAIIMCFITVSLVEMPLSIYKYFFYINSRGNSYIISDPILHHVWNPNLEMLDAARSIPYTLKINSQSFVEEYEVQMDKPSDNFRVVHLGDSNTQGVVEPKFKFVEILEKYWNDLIKNSPARLKVSKHFESINSGTTSWSTILYYLALKSKIINFNPDLVVIHIDMTDFGNDVGYMPFVKSDESGDPIACIGGDDIENAMMDEYVYMTPGGTITIPKPWLLKVLVPYLSTAFYLDRFLYKFNLWRYQDEFGLESIYQSAPEKFDSAENQVKRSLNILEKIIYFARDKKINLFISTLPHYPQFIGKQSLEIHEKVEVICRKNNVACMNGYESLKSSIANTNQDRFYWSNDPTHFNPDGNKIYAEHLIEALKKSFPDDFP